MILWKIPVVRRKFASENYFFLMQCQVILPCPPKWSHRDNSVRITLVSQKGILQLFGLCFSAEGWFLCIQMIYTQFSHGWWLDWMILVVFLTLTFLRVFVYNLYFDCVFVKAVYITRQQISMVFFLNILLPREASFSVRKGSKVL